MYQVEINKMRVEKRNGEYEEVSFDKILTRIKSLIANKHILRVSNNGVSAIINNNAKIIKFSELNKSENINSNIRISSKKSYFYIHHYLNIYIIVSFFILLIFVNYHKDEK